MAEDRFAALRVPDRSACQVAADRHAHDERAAERRRSTATWIVAASLRNCCIAGQM